MRRIEKLEFLPRSSTPIAGLLLLALSLLCLAWELTQLRQVRDQHQAALAAMETKSAKLASRATSNASPDATRSLALAAATSKQLATPWAALLGSLESAAARDVALLKIEPNSLEGQIRITGEARNTDAMLNYVHRLQSTEPLAGIALQSHQISNEKPGSPTRFVLSGSWGAGPTQSKKPGV
jgi:hypothetical protein